MTTRMLLRSPKTPFQAVSADRMLTDSLMGGNSGNLIFLESAYKLLNTRDTEITLDRFAPDKIGADVINERFDVYVIPFANAFRSTFVEQLARYASVIEKLKIPVVVLSVGYQGKLPYVSGESRPIDDGVRRLVKAVLDRSGSIGVRGEITQDFVKKLGFSDVEVIGCPSMFLNGDQLSITKKTPTLERDARIGVNITARVTPMGPIVTSNMERYPNLEYIAQDKDALRLLLWGYGSKHIADPSPLPVHLSHPLIRDDRTKFFVDPWPWLDHMRETDFVFGTRIHGNITALLAGTPGYVFAHDSRTLELARYFEIPHREMADIPIDIDVADLYAEADYGPTMAGHAARYRTYIEYVERHGLKHVFQPGEDPAAFDARVAAVHFPPPVGRRRFLAIHRATRRGKRLLGRAGDALTRRARRKARRRPSPA